MKKFLAVLLSVAMMASMSAVSFAARVPGSLGPDVDLYGPLLYDEDEYTVNEPDGDLYVIEYGDTVYYGLIEEGNAVKDHDQVEKLKIKYEAEVGAELVEEIKLVKLRINVGRGEYDYFYFVAIKLTDKWVTYESDVVGEFELDRKANSKKNIPQIKDYKQGIEFDVFYENTWILDSDYYLLEEGDELQLIWGERYAIKFDGDEEASLTFGTEPNEGEFEVDISGQGKIYFELTTDADEAIVAANPEADIHFVNFIGVNGGAVKFNRAGEFTYEMEDGAYAYYIVDGVLNEIPNAYDDAEEAFVFTTNKLGYYAFSDMALVNPAA